MSRPIWSDQILFGLSTYKKRLPVRKGFSVVEVLLASTVFVLLVTGLVGALIYGREAAATAGQRGRATALAEEGIEALRNLRDEGFSNLVDGPHGLDEISSEWQYSGTSDITDGFARVVTIGSVDADTKSVTSTVTWQQTPSRTGSVSLVTYLTDWQETVGGGPGGGSPATYGGMLAYSDTTVNGGDGVVYKTLDTAGNWSAAANVPDITVPNDRPAVRVELHASPTRDEKILLTKHSANGPGADTYMYAQVWDGGTTSWGNLITLASWAGTADAGAQNLDGAYLSGGDFLLVFDNNDNTPLYRTWDGTTWSSAAGTLDVGGNPTWLHVAGRSGTNEAMMTTFDTGNDTNTALFDGTSWGGLTEHADPGDSPGFDQFDLAEFTWSQSDLTRGGLIYNEANDSAPNIRIFDRTGGAFGSWGGTVENISIGANVQAATVEDNPAALEYVGCFEDANADITCLESDTTPSWSSPTNGVLDTDTGPGTERSFDFVYERVGGDRGLALYSGGNGSPRQFPKYRTYDPSTNTFSTDTAMVTIGDLLEAVELIADPRSDDIMAVMGATDQDVWTVVWDGSSNVFVTTLGAALTEHGTNGTGDSDFWFDFAWNEF